MPFECMRVSFVTKVQGPGAVVKRVKERASRRVSIAGSRPREKVVGRPGFNPGAAAGNPTSRDGSPERGLRQRVRLHVTYSPHQRPGPQYHRRTIWQQCQKLVAPFPFIFS